MGLDLGEMEILHAAEYIDRLMEQGSLVPRNRASMVATFLDGTYPGRRHAVYGAPRRILERIAGLTLREMVWNRELAYACGEPGGVFHSLHPELSGSLAQRVLEEAANTGAEVLITACPATLTLFQRANQTNLVGARSGRGRRRRSGRCPVRSDELSPHSSAAWAADLRIAVLMKGSEVGEVEGVQPVGLAFPRGEEM